MTSMTMCARLLMKGISYLAVACMSGYAVAGYVLYMVTVLLFSVCGKSYACLGERLEFLVPSAN